MVCREQAQKVKGVAQVLNPFHFYLLVLPLIRYVHTPTNRIFYATVQRFVFVLRGYNMKDVNYLSCGCIRFQDIMCRSLEEMI